MTKYLKKYDKTTGEWKVISAPSSVSAESYEDTEILVTNSNYANSTGETYLDEALDVISDDISLLKRNVSWLAKYGGGGGYGGGGTSNSYAIAISNSNFQYNSESKQGYFDSSSNSSLVFKMLISNSSKTDKFEYTVYFDNSRIETASLLGAVGTSISIPLSKFNSKLSEHTLQITATDPDGMSIDPLSITISEKSLVISCDKTRDSIAKADLSSAIVTINVKNTVKQSITTLYFKNILTNESYKYQYTSESILEIPIEILWTNISANSEKNVTYAVEIYAEASIGSSTMQSNTITIQRTITSTNIMTITLNNITDIDYYKNGVISLDEIDSVHINEPKVIGFTAYKQNAKDIYYAIKIGKIISLNTESIEVGNEVLLRGDYFDDTLHNEGKTVYSDNTFTTSDGSDVNLNFTPNSTYSLGYYLITVRCWYKENSAYISADKQGILTVKEAGDVYFGFQNPKNAYSKYDCIARWNTNESDTNELLFTRDDTTNTCQWQSKKTEYWSRTLSDAHQYQINMDIRNVNNISNGMIDNILKLYNNAYGKIDLSPLATEVIRTDGENAGTELEKLYGSVGFTLSVTFKAIPMPDNQNTILYWGDENNYIKITLENAIWYVGGTSISAYIDKDSINTVDFVYDVSKGISKIYVNGVIYASSDSIVLKELKDIIYVGCDKNIENNANVIIYDISLFAQAISDPILIVNGYNNRINNMGYDADTLKDIYTAWRHRNYFYDKDEKTNPNNEPLTLLWNNSSKNFKGFGTDGTVTDSDGYASSDIEANAPLPIIYIEIGSTSNFSRDSFLDATGSKTELVGREKIPDCTFTYYDPKYSSNVIDNISVSLSIQGSSSLKYRSKNLELYFGEYSETDAEKYQVEDNQRPMFTPKSDWFPEDEFTLKADISDSAHANNASIGRWINENTTDLFERTPIQRAIDENPPKKLKSTWTKSVSSDSEAYETDDENEIITYSEPKVKNAIEGFPVLLLIKWYGNSYFENVGIYSFNIGRYSKYNLGMRALKAYRREYENGPSMVYQYVPYLRNETDTITYTEGTQKTISTNDIYAFEFDQAADTYDTRHPTWSQDNLNIIKTYGSFTMIQGIPKDSNEIIPLTNTIWDKLKNNLFYCTARLSPYYTIYNMVDGQYSATTNTYASTTEIASQFSQHFSIQNALYYFVICNTFGMIDSLGKNMVLRTWDGGNKWYPTFYDMDTALGLNNDGDEAIDISTFIDGFSNYAYYTYTDGNGVQYTENCLYNIPSDYRSNVTVEQPADDINTPYMCKRNYEGCGWSARGSKLWDLLRTYTTVNQEPLASNYSEIMRSYADQKDYTHTYEYSWVEMRRKVLTSYTSFINVIEDQMGNCGELIYNFDYNYKYLMKYLGSEGKVTYGDINALHGNRINFIKRWLKYHIYFLDGVFDVTSTDLQGYSVDCPFITQTSFALAGATDSCNIYLVRSETPIFVKVWVDNAEWNDKYYIPADTDVYIHTDSAVGDSKQMSISCSSLLTKFQNLHYVKFIHFNGTANLTSISNFVLSGCTNLQSNAAVPIVNFGANGPFVKDGGSYLRTIDLSRTASNTSWSVLLYDESGSYSYDYITDINMSNSCVTNVTLPTNPLTTLTVDRSKIVNLELEGQVILDYLDLYGCNDMITFSMSKCTKINASQKDMKIPYFEISGNTNLTSIDLYKCDSLTDLRLESLNALSSVTLDSLDALTSLTIDSCINENLEVNVTNCKSLSKIVFRNAYTSKIINIDSISSKNISDITLSNLSAFKNILFGKEENDCKYIKKYYADTTQTAYYWLKTDEGYVKKVNNLNSDKIVTETYDVLDFSNLTLTSLILRDIGNLKYLRLPKNESKPFKIDDTVIKGCNSLERIFGSFEVIDNGIFAEKESFYLNYPIAESVDENDYCIFDYDTNYYSKTFDEDGEFSYLTLGSNITDITKMFFDTACNFTDANYILSQCDNVTILTSAFESCPNVIVNKVKYTSNSPYQIYFDNKQQVPIGLFSHCGKVTAADNLFEDCDINGYIPNGLLDPMTSLTKYVSVLGSANHTKCYDSDGNLIPPTDGNGHKSNGYSAEYDTNWFVITGLTKNTCFFPENSNISYIYGFNPASVGIEDNVYYDSSLLYNLKNVENLRIENSFNSCTIDINEYGEEFKEHQSDDKDIFTDINITSIISSFRNIICKNSRSNVDGIVFLIDGLFGIGPTIEVIRNSFILSNQSEEVTLQIYPDTTFNNLVNLKVFSTSENNLGTSEIPFSGTKLVKSFETSTFPEGIVSGCTKLIEMTGLFYNAKINNRESGIMNIPGNLFKYNPELENVSYCFSHFNGQGGFKLTADSFVGTNIKNVSHMFDSVAGMQGYIPYRFLYQGDNKNNITDASYLFYDCSGNTCSAYEADDNTLNNYAFDTAENKWNVWVYDGSSDFVDRLKNTAIYKAHSGVSLPDIFNSHSDTEYDANNVFIYALKDNNFSKRNYICPPDLFKYCSADCNIDSVMENAGHIENWQGSNAMNGLRGTIPSYLFKPLTDITNLKNTFASCNTILPESWNNSANTDYNGFGYMYPEDLFYYNTSLNTISSVFSGTTLFGGTMIPYNLFSNNKVLTTVDGTWADVTFTPFMVDDTTVSTTVKLGKDGYYGVMIPDGLFRNCTILATISTMFYYAEGTIVIDDKLFGPIADGEGNIIINSNKRISDAGSFMEGVSCIYGSVPTLWDVSNFSYLNSPTGRHSNTYGYIIDESYITNYSEIPNDKTNPINNFSDSE